MKAWADGQAGQSMTLEADEVPAVLRGHEEAVDGLRQVGRLFYARGWSVGTSSNYSIVSRHDPLELIVTASGKDKGALTAADFVRVDARGEPCEPGQPKSSAETLLHCLLAQRSDVGAILHTHSVWSTILSDLFFADGGIVLEDFEMLKGLAGVTTHQHRAWVDIFDNSQDIPALVRAIEDRWSTAQRVGSTNGPPHLVHGFLLRQHGLYTWGRDLFEARRHVEIFEFLFECVARKMMLRGCRDLR